MAKSEDGLGLLVLSGKPEKGKPMDMESGDDSAKMLAAKGLIKALKSEDPGKVASAFEEMMYCCDDDSEEGEDEGSKEDLED